MRKNPFFFQKILDKSFHPVYNALIFKKGFDEEGAKRTNKEK